MATGTFDPWRRGRAAVGTADGGQFSAGRRRRFHPYIEPGSADITNVVIGVASPLTLTGTVPAPTLVTGGAFDAWRRGQPGLATANVQGFDQGRRFEPPPQVVRPALGAITVQGLDLVVVATSAVLIADDAVSAVTAVSPAILQFHTIVPQSAMSALAIGTPAVPLEPNIGADQLAFSVSLGSPTVIQDHLLTAGSLALAMALEGTAFSTIHILSPTNSALGLSIASPILDQVHAMETSDLVLESSAAETTINTPITLAPDALVLASSLDATTVILGIPAIQPASMSSSLSVSAPTLVENITLEASDSSSQSRLDPTVVSHIHTLTPAASSIGMTIQAAGALGQIRVFTPAPLVMATSVGSVPAVVGVHSGVLRLVVDISPEMAGV